MGQTHRDPPRRAVVSAPAAAPQREVSAVRGEDSSGPWRRTTRLSPLPWPWLSSGPLGRYGASLQPGPWRRSSAHVATMTGAVALYAAKRLPLRCQHQPWSTSKGTTMSHLHKTRATCLGLGWWWWCWCWCGGGVGVGGVGGVGVGGVGGTDD